MNPATTSPIPKKGFSLIEVVVALGLIAVGVIPLLALLAISTDQHGDANQESIATIIAQSISTDLRRSSEALGGIVYRYQSSYDMSANLGSSNEPNSDFAIAPFSAGGDNIDVLYGISTTEFATATGNWSYQPIRTLGSSDYTDGVTDQGATHIVRISYAPPTGGTLSHESLAGTSAGTGIFTPPIYEVTINVEAPAQAPETERETYVFRTYATYR